MAGVPDGHLRGQFLRWYPVHHQVIARSETAALEYIVQDQQDGHYGYHRIDEIRSAALSRDGVAEVSAPSENKVQDYAGRKTEREMPSWIGPVRNEAVDELRYSVDYANQRQDDTEVGIRDSIFSAEGRHCEGKVLPYEIEDGIAYHRADDDSPLPILEGFLCLHLVICLQRYDLSAGKVRNI